jgi:hypothetical protein
MTDPNNASITPGDNENEAALTDAELPLLQQGDPEAERRNSEKIDELAHAARDAGVEDIATQTALWKAVFSLERWFFIPRGDMDAMADVQPLAVVVDEQPMLLAFTSPERARQSAITLGLTDEEAAHVLAVPSEGMVESAEGYSKVGLQGVLFDYGWTGFYAPLGQLGPIRSHSLAN